MTQELLETIVKRSPHLHWMLNRTIFITRHGSMAYNTNIEGSDEDFKGITIPTKPYFFGYLDHFEQAELKTPDTSIYNISKFFSLAAACNPNIIEMLYTDPKDHVLVTHLGETLLENRSKFLSKRIKYTMCGYAFSQLKRLRRHRQWLLKGYDGPPTRASLGLPEKPAIDKNQFDAVSAAISKHLEKYNFDFLHDCPEATKIAIKNAWQETLFELKVSLEDQWLSSARQIGLSDNLIQIMQRERAYRAAVEDYKKYLIWQKERNPERYELEKKFKYDTKFGYHLVRLLRQAEEALSTGKLTVYRPDREELVFIRKGGWSFERLEEFVIEKEKSLEQLYYSCNILPDRPNFVELNDLLISIIEQSF